MDNKLISIEDTTQSFDELKDFLVSYIHIDNMKDVVLVGKLKLLESFLVEDFNHSLQTIDESIQFLPNILSRLYLLITIANVRASKEATIADSIRKQLVVSCQGIQDPLDGLLLRHYMLGLDALTSVGTKLDIIEFLLHNFSAMTKLFVQTQYLIQNKKRQVTYKNRQELIAYVMRSLQKLASLDAIMTSQYCNIFPAKFHLATLAPLLRTFQRLPTRFSIGRPIFNLMLSLIRFVISELKQGHALEIPPLSSARDGVISDIVNTSIQHHQGNSSCTELIVFLYNELGRILGQRITAYASDSTRPSVDMRDYGLDPYAVPSIYSALLILALWLFHLDVGVENRPVHALRAIDHCFRHVTDHLSHFGSKRSGLFNKRDVVEFFFWLLHTPIRHSSMRKKLHFVEQLPNAVLPPMFTVLATTGVKRFFDLSGNDLHFIKAKFAHQLLSIAFKRVAIDAQMRAISIVDLDSLVMLAGQLLSNVDNSHDIACDVYWDKHVYGDIALSRHQLLTRLHHLIGPVDKVGDLELTYQLLEGYYERLTLLSGNNPVIVKSNTISFVFESINLLRAIHRSQHLDSESRQVKLDKTVELIRNCLATRLLESGEAMTSIQLLLQTALAIDNVQFSSTSFDLVFEALKLFEDPLFSPPLRYQLKVVNQLISTLGQLRGCLKRDELADRLLQSITKQVLSKADQSRALTLAALGILWPAPRWNRLSQVQSLLPVDFVAPNACLNIEKLNEMRDCQTALLTINHSAQLANECIDLLVKLKLLIENLEAAVTLQARGCPTVTDQYVSERVAQIETLTSSLPESLTGNQIKAHYTLLRSFISDRLLMEKQLPTTDV